MKEGDGGGLSFYYQSHRFEIYTEYNLKSNAVYRKSVVLNILH